ncbi:MFS polyamine transporter [Hysterangium stoloniferum]|nr:MFS polyamine transporter [Hysterangium stoloniferum]
MDPLSRLPSHTSGNSTLFGETLPNEKLQERQDGLSKDLEGGIANRAGISDIIIVNWDGENDPTNPRNWTKKKKWAATAVVLFYIFLHPIASSMMAPATNAIAHDLKITNSVVLAMTVSIYLFAYAFGPLLFGPLSELFGRARVIQLAILFFLVFNIACGFAQNTSQLLAFRFLAGFGGSAPLSDDPKNGGGVIGDCFSPEERGQAIAIYSLAPMLGPVLGAAAGAFITEYVSWRWVFYGTSIACGFAHFLGLIFLQETFPPVLLAQKAQKIRSERGIPPNDRTLVRTEYDSPDRHWQALFATALTRPFVFLFHEHIIQLLGVYMAFVYAVFIVSMILDTIPDIFENIYEQPVGIAGCHYIAMGLGLTVASQINVGLLDNVYKHFQNKNGGVGKPEFRLPFMAIGLVFLCGGLLMFGWAAENHVNWIVADIGISFISAGIIVIYQSIQSYMVDAFTLYAASALAPVAFLRALAAFGFPLFAPAMYHKLGYGIGDSILAVSALVIGVPAPFLFWFFGERIRNKSRHAAGSRTYSLEP